MKKNIIINIVITVIYALLYYYIFIPPINLSSPEFYSFVLTTIVVYGILDLGVTITSKVITFKKRPEKQKFKFNIILLVPIIFMAIIILNFIYSPIFNSKSYANRIVIDETGNFKDDIKEVDFKKVPLLDKDSSQKLGDRVMGEMSDLVSQYYVSDLYTQINYREEIIRVTPLEYADLIKYITNRKDGIKGYITVNSVTGESKIVRLDKGIRYVPSAILNEDMMRHLRFIYPTEIFGTYTFEIDDEGNPYFIIPTIKYTGVGLKKDIDGVIALDPITGDTTKYDIGNVPNWVDHVYEPDLIIEQTDDWGTYKGGFLNSLFAQKNVVNTTEGYNYLAMDGDIFLYTGITSIQSDESNLGFILSNMRTKETAFYSAPGAEEYSAMASAQGQVQEMSYNSTFPLLINLQGRPTYLVSLKDAAGLVKKYAFIDVQDYQKVTVSDVSLGIEKASEAYLNSYNLDSPQETTEKTIKISSVNTAIIEGNTIYFIEDNEKRRYSANITVSKNILPFLKTGESYVIEYVESEVSTIKSIKKAN